MSGKYKGCATILKERYPLAIYSHYCSHVLNLAVVNTCGSIQVQNLFAVAGKVHRFFDNHPKRQYLLNKFCKGSSKKVKALCNTRWLQRIDTLHVFMDLFDSIIKALDDVVANASNWSRDALMDAMSLNKAMLDFEFIITLYVVERYLSYTESLTRSLQVRALDILRAVDHIATLKQVLTDARSGIDEQFHLIFTNASRCARKHNVDVTMPRRCSRQTARENHPGDTAEEYYRRSLAIPFLAI